MIEFESHPPAVKYIDQYWKGFMRTSGIQSFHLVVFVEHRRILLGYQLADEPGLI